MMKALAVGYRLVDDLVFCLPCVKGVMYGDEYPLNWDLALIKFNENLLK